MKKEEHQRTIRPINITNFSWKEKIWDKWPCVVSPRRGRIVELQPLYHGTKCCDKFLAFQHITIQNFKLLHLFFKIQKLSQLRRMSEWIIVQYFVRECLYERDRHNRSSWWDSCPLWPSTQSSHGGKPPGQCSMQSNNWNAWVNRTAI